MVGVDPNTIDQALHRLIESGDVIRPARGTYALAPPKLKPPLPPAPTVGGREYAEWLADLERWYSNPSTWDVATLGPRPGDPKNRVPVMVLMMYRRRLDAREKAPRKPLRRPRRKPKRRGRPPRLTTSSCARSCSTPPWQLHRRARHTGHQPDRRGAEDGPDRAGAVRDTRKP
jgi:hypothetical protein